MLCDRAAVYDIVMGVIIVAVNIMATTHYWEWCDHSRSQTAVDLCQDWIKQMIDEILSSFSLSFITDKIKMKFMMEYQLKCGNLAHAIIYILKGVKGHKI